ncbi:MAG: class C beta-lactamase-related serine hydrolase [Balneolaceae bacterium]|nr:MAG: class C beta-lactamase-related serine hydrolase [Balneolaceae bacterium]
MKVFIKVSVLFILLSTFHGTGLVYAQQVYVPPAAEWAYKDAAELGFDADALDDLLQFAIENENSVETDLRLAILKAFSHEPYHELLGPVRDRGGPAGLIVKDGYIAAKWGDPGRVDMTFSVTKSYLSTVAGLAWDRGLIRDTDDVVKDYVWDRTFDGEHNSAITWHHLLNQSSDWMGTHFGLDDWGDRPPREGGIDDWRMRELRKPGTHYEYNDVRVNVLSYSLLQVFREPLPVILRENIMDPIGASTTWRWFGYDESWTMIDGLKMQSVSGGGHHGGGLFINTYDQARFGLLFARRGMWGTERLLSEEWIDKAKAPSEPNPDYGYMWWTLKGDTTWEGVPDHVYYAAGFGGNYIIIDEENDLVVVLRWIDNSALGEFMERVYQAME